MKRDNLIARLKSNQMVAKALIDDITEEESLAQGKDNLTPIKWQTGHLVVHVLLMQQLLGGKPEGIEKRTEQFGRGSDPLENGSEYPSVATLRQELHDAYDKNLALAEEATDEYLDRPTPKEIGFKQSIFDTLLFLCAHDFYHFGQIVTVRRCLLGRDQPFG